MRDLKYEDSQSRKTTPTDECDFGDLIGRLQSNFLDNEAYNRDNVAKFVGGVISKIVGDFGPKFFSMNSNALIETSDPKISDQQPFGHPNSTSMKTNNERNESMGVDPNHVSEPASTSNTVPQDECAQNENSFVQFGISDETANVLGNCTYNFKQLPNLNLNDQKVPVPSKLKTMDKRTLQDGHRQYQSKEWTSLIDSVIKEFNPYCVWKFNRHYIKAKGSRKNKTPYMTCNADCKVEGCGCGVIFSIFNETDNEASINFTGTFDHKNGKTAARHVRGGDRNDAKRLFESNVHTQPSRIYREKLNAITPNVYASGNRNSCGSKKVFQNIKHEATIKFKDLNFLHKELLNIQKEMATSDEKSALEAGHGYRRFFGYIQSFLLNPSEISIMLFTEGCIRLYHQIIEKDILYADASGNLISNIDSFKKIFNYCLSLRHPLSRAPPLPVMECISSEHTEDAVRKMLVQFRGKEFSVFGSRKIPKLLICDNSKVLINACLFEFNGETMYEYLNRLFLMYTKDKLSEESKH